MDEKIKARILDLMRDPKMQKKGYLRFWGGAEMLAIDVYRFVLSFIGSGW